MENIVPAIKLGSNIFSSTSRALEFLIVVFLIAQYFKPQSNYKSAYFVILNIGYMADLVVFINWAIPFDINVYYFTLVIIEWYTTFFITIWNVVLCVNRCTALVFTVKYEKIWTPLTMFCIIIFMLAFPFIVDSYTLFSSNCTVANFANCMNLRVSYFFTGTIINAALNGITFILIGFCMYWSRQDKFHVHSTHAKTERRLIYQAIFSCIFQCICFFLKFLASKSFEIDVNIFLFLTYASNIGYSFHHYVVMLTHFILSRTFRMAFLNFYRLGNLTKKSKISTVANISKSNPTKITSAVTRIV